MMDIFKKDRTALEKYKIIQTLEAKTFLLQRTQKLDNWDREGTWDASGILAGYIRSFIEYIATPVQEMTL